LNAATPILRSALGAERLGYPSPADMVDRYPQFYWSKVERYIGDAPRYREMTIE
jgi:hypothetical protein